jgi:hypothetical protein
MEGTSCADDMRLLHERIEHRFSFSFSSDWFFGGRSGIIRLQSDTINVRSILGAIEEDGVMVRLQVISKQSLCRGQTLNSNL